MKEQICAWYTRNVCLKPNKAVVKLFHDDGAFLSAVNIPTVMWPLNASYEVFNYNNCELIEDQIVIDAVNAIEYRIGHCYQNAQNVTNALQALGYDAKQYVGWMFVGEGQWPLHHSWTVLNGTHVIDLADDQAVLDFNHDKFEGASLQENRERLVDFTKWIRQFPHSKRCMPFGVPSPRLLYIGCECSREQGINIYNNLVRTFPNHPCKERVQANNRTRMQDMLAENGFC